MKNEKQKLTTDNYLLIYNEHMKMYMIHGVEYSYICSAIKGIVPQGSEFNLLCGILGRCLQLSFH